MQDETEMFTLRSTLIVEDHFAISVLRSLADILATDECEPYRSMVIQSRCCTGTTDAASVTLRIEKAIPIYAGRLETADKHAAGPIGIDRDGNSIRDDKAPEVRVGSHFKAQL